MLERIKDRISLKRMGYPDEVAFFVSYLASDLSSYMTGTAIPVTGGADLFAF
ncbi:MAG: SDR family oxidoreductase [Proteobacteria bacterium]|nr:SDR family oxidoreductase [Pseudomonadota bacterium]